MPLFRPIIGHLSAARRWLEGQRCRRMTGGEILENVTGTGASSVHARSDETPSFGLRVLGIFQDQDCHIQQTLVVGHLVAIQGWNRAG
jgi:hypothetical protein